MIYRKKCWEGRCDGCGETFAGEMAAEGGFVHHNTREAMVEDMKSWDWVVEEERVLCDECREKEATNG